MIKFCECYRTYFITSNELSLNYNCNKCNLHLSIFRKTNNHILIYNNNFKYHELTFDSKSNTIDYQIIDAYDFNVKEIAKYKIQDNEDIVEKLYNIMTCIRQNLIFI